MMMRIVLFFLLISIPCRVVASVRISEIAWMGIAGEGGQYGEWIELYNDGTEEASLSGWKIFVDGGAQLLFALSKSIPAGGYLLVERTTASMTDPVPGITGEHGPFGSGGLSNVGEDMVLKDASGVIVHALNFASGWPAGDATTKQTMQWNGSLWQTAVATPGVGMSTVPITEEEETETPEEDLVSSGTPPNTVIERSKPIPKPKPDPHIELLLPKQLSIHTPYRFKASVTTEDGMNPHQGVYRWNFGDGFAREEYQNLLPVLHVYEHPGTYTLFFGYYDSFFAEDPTLYVQRDIVVTAPGLSLSLVDDALRIENTAAAPMDLSGFSVHTNGFISVLPSMTIIGPRAAIMLSATRLGIALDASTTLHATDGFVVGRISVPTVPVVLGAITVPEAIEVVAASDIAELELPPAPAPFAPLPEKPNRDTNELLLGIAGGGVLGLFFLIDRLISRKRRS